MHINILHFFKCQLISYAQCQVAFKYNLFLGKYLLLFQSLIHAEDRDYIIQARTGFEKCILKTN